MSMPGGPHPHPYFWHRHYHHMYRRGSFFPRLLWFGLGFGTYAWYSHCKETGHSYWNHHRQAAHGDEWRSWTAHRWGYPPRDRFEQARPPMLDQQVQGTPLPPSPVQTQQDLNEQRVWGRGLCPRSRAQNQARDDVHQSNPMPMMAAASSDEPELQNQPFAAPAPREQPFQWHAERIREAGKATTESMSDMSEQALDSLISSIQGLKEKLAASRQEREARSPERKPSEAKDKRLV